jgi:hypothetical protein
MTGLIAAPSEALIARIEKAASLLEDFPTISQCVPGR